MYLTKNTKKGYLKRSVPDIPFIAVTLLSFHGERITLCVPATACIAATDIYALCMALIITVVNTFACFTINTDCFARMIQRTLIAVTAFVYKAFATGIHDLLRLASANHDITLTAVMILIIGTVDCRTF